MSIFRIRDYLSVLLYRLFRGLFGSFGRGVRVVWPLRLVGMRYMHLGNDVTIASTAYIAALQEFGDVPRLEIGSGTRIGDFAHIICTHQVSFGRDVLAANRGGGGVFISDCDHAFQDITVPVIGQGLKKGGPVSIGSGSWIGENVCILSARIGRHCVIGANSIVTGDIPDHSVVVGAPGRIVRRYDPDREEWLSTDSTGRFLDDDTVSDPLPIPLSRQV